MDEKVINMSTQHIVEIEMENDKFKVKTELKELPITIVEALLNQVSDAIQNNVADKIINEHTIKLASDKTVQDLFKQIRIYRFCIILLLVTLLLLTFK